MTSDEDLEKSRERIRAKIRRTNIQAVLCLLMAIVLAGLFLVHIVVPVLEAFNQVERNRIDIKQHKEDGHGK